MSKLLSELIPEYQEWRLKIRRMKPSTINSGASHLRCFVGVVGDMPVHKVTPEMVDAAVAARSHVGLATLNNYQACLDALFGYARARGYTPGHHNPTGHLEPHRTVKRQRQHIPPERFMDALDATKNERDRILVAVPLFLFVRVSELRTLRVGDVDLEKSRIRVTVHKSGGYVDDMPIVADLDRELRRWLTHYQRECGPLDPDWFLVPALSSHATGVNGRGSFADADAGRKLVLHPERQLQRPDQIAHDVLHAIGMPTKDRDGKPLMEGMHTLRRSGARMVFDAMCERSFDGALRLVQSMLHHAQSSTTELYLGLDLDRARRDRELTGSEMLAAVSLSDTVGNVVRLPLAGGGR